MKISKKIHFCILYIIILFTSQHVSHAYSTGIAGSTYGCTCHGGGVPNPATSIKVTSLTGTFNIEPGDTLSLRAVVAHNKNNLFGIDIAVRTTDDPFTGFSGQGALAPDSNESDLRLLSQELVQKFPKKGINDTVMFEFIWIAPKEAGTYYLHIAANAVNGDDLPDEDDQWNLITPIAFTVGATSVAEFISSLNISVAPNPFSDRTSLNFFLEKRELCEISIIDFIGRKVFYQPKQYYDAGNHSFTWDGRDVQGNIAQTGQYLAYLVLDEKRIYIPIFLK